MSMVGAGRRLDADFDQIRVLRDGRRVRVRFIRPSDAPLIQAGYKRLSPESRYMRFFGAMSRLPDHALRYLTEVDEENHVALVALSLPDADGPERALGVARFVRSSDDRNCAEVAVTVADEIQRGGLGTLLVVMLGAAARERAIGTFVAYLLSSNTRARRLMLKLGARPWKRRGDVSSCFLSTAELAETGIDDESKDSRRAGTPHDNLSDFDLRRRTTSH